MRTSANIPEWQQPVEVYRFQKTKVNKHSTIYSMVGNPTKTTFLTPVVRIEKFQGYSKAYNLAEYFRIKDQSNWKNSQLITGLWKTSTKGWYYGDKRDGNIRTLLLFDFRAENDQFRLSVFPTGYCPSPARIEAIISAL